MTIKKLFLAATIQSILFAATPVFAGDVEIHLPSASDAMTVDQPAGNELMRVNGDGSVGVGTTTPSDGTSNGGQALKLDVEGAVGATHFCDENGENCQTAASLGAANAGTAMAFKVTSTDTTTVQVRNTAWKMDTEWAATPEINTFSNSAFANGTFTVGSGESGLYEIFARANIYDDEGRDRTSIYVNGAVAGLSSISTGTNTSLPSSAYGLANLAEGDTVEVYSNYDHSTTNQPLNCTAGACYFTLQKIGAAANGGGADNLGSHTATKDIDLAANKLVGNGGTEGVAIDVGGNVAIGANAISDGTTNGGQPLKLDVEGAVGASHYCDQNGENCLTAAELAAGGGGGGGVLAVGEKIGTTEASLTETITIAQDAVLVTRGESRANHNPSSQSNKAITPVLQVDGVTCGYATSYAYINNATWQAEATCIKELSAGTYNLELLNNLSSGGTRTASKLQYVLHAKGSVSGGSATADDLGNHTATQDIDLAANKLVGNGGTEGVAIDAGGNVGVGTTSPSDGTPNGGQALKLDVEGAIGATHLCDSNGENCTAVADLGASGGTQKEYLDTHIVINYINNTGAVTVTEPNFDLSTLTTVPAWATHAIVMGRTLVAQSGGFTGGSSSSSIKLSHNGLNFNNLSIAAAYGGSGQADRSDDSNTQEVRIRDGKLIGFISATSDGGNTGQSTQAMLHLIGFAGYQ